MAVFADRIILKSSSDSEAAISAAITPGGADEIIPGEIVIGITPGTARLYTLDANNQVVTLGGTAATQLAGLIDVDVTTNPPTPNQSLAYDATNNVWVPSTPIVGATEMNELLDVDLDTNQPSQGDSLIYDEVQSQFIVGKPAYTINEITDVDLTSIGVTEGDSLIYDSASGTWQPGVPNIVGLAEVEQDPSPALGGTLEVNDNPISAAAGGDILLLNDGIGSVVIDNLSGPGELVFSDQGSDRVRLKVNPSQTGSWSWTMPGDNGTSGYVLSTNGAGVSSWVRKDVVDDTTPQLGGDLDVNGREIQSGTDEAIVLRHGHNGTTDFRTSNSTTRALLRIFDGGNVTSGNYYTGLRSQATASWILDLPNGPGTSGQVLTTNGSGVTSWQDGPAADLSINTLGDIGDVNLNPAPATNQALIWNGSNWVPGAPAADVSQTPIGSLQDVSLDYGTITAGQAIVWTGTEWANRDVGEVDSVNGKVGEVVLDLLDINDVELDRTTASVFEFDYGDSGTPGEWEPDGGTVVILNNSDRLAGDFQAYMLGFAGNFPTSFYVSETADDDDWTEGFLSSVVNLGTQWRIVATNSLGLGTSKIYFTFETPPADVQPQTGYVLTFDATKNKYLPLESAAGVSDWADLQNKPDFVEELGDLTDVDFISTPPLNGQVIEYDSATGTWKPGDGTGAVSVSSVNGLTGAVELNIQNLSDYALRGTQGTLYAFNQNIGETDAAYSDGGTWGPANLGSDILLSAYDSNGVDMAAVVAELPATGSVWFKRNIDQNWAGPAAYTAITADYLGTGAYGLEGVGAYLTSQAGADLEVTFVDPTQTPTAIANGDLLTWNDTYERFEPTPPASLVNYLDDLLDVDTSSAGHVPTDGQSLIWNESMGHWMPDDVATRIQDQTDFLKVVSSTATIIKCFQWGLAAGPGRIEWTADSLDFNRDQYDWLTSEELSMVNDVATGSSMWFTFDDPESNESPTWYKFTWTNHFTGGNYAYYRSGSWENGEVPNNPGYGYGSSLQVWIAGSDPTSAITRDPLVTGDFIRYDGAFFRPHQLADVATSADYSDLVNKPELKTRVQDMDDVLTNLADPQTISIFETTAWGVGGGRGRIEWGSTTLYFNRDQYDHITGDDVSVNDYLSGSSTYYFSFDDPVLNKEPKWFVFNRTSDSSSGVYKFFGGTWANDEVPNNPGYGYGSPVKVWIAGSDPTGAVLGTIVADDYLRFDGSRFRPQQLAAIATSGDFADLIGSPSLAAVATSGSIADLNEVDVTSQAPAVGQALVWTGTTWEPQTVTLDADSVALAPVRVEKTKTAINGEIDFSENGTWGVIVSVSSDISAWVSVYASAAQRTADVGRQFGTDPSPGSGVLAEFLGNPGQVVMATPGTTFFNGDTPQTRTVYVLCRSTNGSTVDATVTLSTYTVGVDSYDGVDGGTFGSG